jgi:anaerobic ribonucleoside-triphosphate reductase activating protein
LKTLKFNVAAIHQCTEAEGPFKRMAVWFQGCDKHCPECCNPGYFPLKPAHILSLDALLEIAADAKRRFAIEGVTYLGGEPVLQAGLAELSQALRALDLGLILFTGRLYEALPAALIESVDMIIDGGFEKDNIDTERNLIGSKNQKMYFCSQRYKNCLDWFYIPRPKRVEIHITDALTINGDYTGDFRQSTPFS